MALALTLVLGSALLIGCDDASDDATGGGGDASSSSSSSTTDASSSSGAPAHHVVVDVSGLEGVLTVGDGAQTLSVIADGSYAFDANLSPGASYTVTISTSPGVQRCEISNGAGVIAMADMHAQVTCATRLFFLGDDGVAGPELWSSDGTDAGTVMVKDLEAGPGGSKPGTFASLGDGRVLFVANDGSGDGDQLHVTDGTAAGTAKVTTIGGGVHPDVFTVIDGVAFFMADDGVHGLEPWRTDGTAAGTFMLADIHATGDSQTGSRALGVAGKKALFGAGEASGMTSVWTSDGTAAGTTKLLDVGAGEQAPENFFTANAKVYFKADDGVVGSELWVSDGTLVGTHLVRELNPGPNGSYPITHVAFGSDEILIEAFSDADGYEAWRSDGTAAGTVQLGDLYPGPIGSFADSGLALGTKALFRVNEVDGSEIWVTDGTAQSTMKLVDPTPTGSSGGGILGSAGGVALLTLVTPTEIAVWSSDGTPVGTKPLKTLNAIGKTDIEVLGTRLGAVFFVASDGTKGYELWKSDGTAAGTTVVKDLCPGSCDGFDTD